MTRRLLIGGGVVLLVAALAAAIIEPVEARSLALDKLRHERPGVAWQVAATQFYWRPDHVYDPAGHLVASEEGGPPLQPTFFVYLTGTSPAQTYSAVVGVDALTRRVGSWGVLTAPKT